jgi:hypothetical protein
VTIIWTIFHIFVVWLYGLGSWCSGYF